MPTLLVVDDDRSVLHMVSHAFKDSPITVLTAVEVTEALDVVRRGVDLVLLDIMLPEISGLEAARKFHALDPKLPVVFITASGTSETAIEAMKLGAYDYLIKPLDLGESPRIGAANSGNTPPDEGSGGVASRRVTPRR